jgi:type II secretory pathway pseudopilin PulG
MRLNPLHNQKGVTLLEVMFALGILIVGTYLTVKGVDSLQDATRATKNMSSTERQISMIVDNIRTSLGMYQINYSYAASAKEDALAIAKLPMEWDPGVERPLTDDCKNHQKCLGGRYGFVIQPVEQARGLYTITLRMTHRDWKEPFREYQFLVTVQ